ncbi:SDR family oxidoreductase [Pedobacter insulae]|uniref:Gluconate 5-dehydrogenase n=1 Tax=Pedobacter insulae TaxID=414048 RepID=A0A1I2TC99_9SPHI|nr:SDR family oxidoreductase [Pedobacter insulae]SFG62533.1 gluconate 5-dehydrogenase [Pedobacter insulae]
MIQTFDLKSKVVLITGGYGHLGRAITESLVYHGAKVYVLGRDVDKFNLCFNENAALDKNLFFEETDVSNTISIKNSFNKIFSVEGRIDVLVNNAFYSKGQSPEKMTDEEWSYGIDGNLGSTFRCMREIIPFFKELKGGKIINVSSMYGIVAPQFEVYEGFPSFLNPPHYGAAKAGVIQMTKYYASYLGHLNINVNTITPGPFPSNSVKVNEGFIKALESKTCLNKIGEPEDLAGAFVFLASDASNFITGQNLIIDGGWTAK